MKKRSKDGEREGRKARRKREGKREGEKGAGRVGEEQDETAGNRKIG